jgi:hypothetical protein
MWEEAVLLTFAWGGEGFYDESQREMVSCPRFELRTFRT